MIIRTLTYQVAQKEAGRKVCQILSGNGYSNQIFTQLKKKPGSVLLNEKEVRLQDRAAAGDSITVHIEENGYSPHILPARLPLHILYEDADLLVVSKAAGMPTHPSGKNRTNSLASALTGYYKEKGIPFVFRCSSRLDQDTSGLTVVAKHMVSAAVLSAMVKRREIKREYLGLVRGSVKETSGVIDVPLLRIKGEVLFSKADWERGERAVTHYRVVAEQNGYSLVHFLLETGRTHQIRAHMKYIGAPLAGDYLYRQDEEPAGGEGIGRQALHAYRLTFCHPVIKKKMEFTAPLPADMEGLCSGVRLPDTF